jgi:hypothetical protein
LQQSEFDKYLQDMHEQHFRDLELALAEQRAIDRQAESSWYETDKWYDNDKDAPAPAHNHETLEVSQLRNDRELLQREVT